MTQPGTTEPLPDVGEGLRRLRIDLGYDGAGFSGWARQPGRRTVEGVLVEALARVTRGPEPVVVCAGRTDAGVHARGQVCHVDLPAAWADDAAGLTRRLAGVLPADVRVGAVAVAPPGFDARFAARGRSYAYRLTDDPAGPDPLVRGFVVAHRRPLDVEAMGRAAEGLLGEHDFAAFCRRRQGASTVRMLRRFGWRRDGDGLVVADVEADAFCHSMVRALVGALLPVGDGRRPEGWPREVLLSGARDPAVAVAPAHGLVLERVDYPPDHELADQQRRTRRFRG